LKIELLHVPSCPRVEEARQILRACLGELGLDSVIEERQGPFPSPTVLINGIDVMGEPEEHGPMCRIDLPDVERITSALRAAM
jgi:hypothetical protein